MSELHVRQVRRYLLDRFALHLDMADCQGRAEDQHESKQLTRATAALAVAVLAGIDAEEACQAVTDGFDDNGIDAIYVDVVEPSLIVVQSKWSKSGTAGIDVAGMKKFLDGFRCLVSGRFEEFNQRIRDRQVEIQSALDGYGVTCRLVLAHNSNEALSAHVQADVQRFLDEMNDTSELVTFEELNQRALHATAATGLERETVDLEIDLSDWGHVDAPYKAWYGTVDVSQVVQWWTSHGNRLFEKNIRRFLDNSMINRVIQDTIEKEPAHFWYFNNGVTLLCSEIARPLANAGNRRATRFMCKGASVINGAQTVGAIGRAGRRLLPAGADGRVLVRLISLEDCPPEFAARVTRATNTQNRIQLRDFAALDPEQKRIAQELQIEGVDYVYKAGETSGDSDSSCTLEDATIALACAHRDSRYGMFAKGFVGKLYDDSDGGPYRALFGERVTGEDVWKAVRVMRWVDSEISVLRASSGGLRRNLMVHGNRFILRQVFRALQASRSRNSQPGVAALTGAAVDMLERGYPEILTDRHLAWVFKNHAKCSELERGIFGNPRAILGPGVDGTGEESGDSFSIDRQTSLFSQR